MSNHVLRIDIEDAVRASVEDESFTPKEIDKIIEKTKEYIYDDDSFWNAFDNCVSDAVIYVRHRRNKIDEQY